MSLIVQYIMDVCACVRENLTREILKIDHQRKLNPMKISCYTVVLHAAQVQAHSLMINSSASATSNCYQQTALEPSRGVRAIANDHTFI